VSDGHEAVFSDASCRRLPGGRERVGKSAGSGIDGGGGVKSKRRVELHIEHREISVFAGAGTLPAQPADPARQDGAGPLPAKQRTCPTCGSHDVILLTDAVSSPRMDLAALNLGMQNGKVHFHLAPSGEWWICTKSLHKS
jgi:hypothetical protein